MTGCSVIGNSLTKTLGKIAYEQCITERTVWIYSKRTSINSNGELLVGSRLNYWNVAFDLQQEHSHTDIWWVLMSGGKV